MIHNIPDLRNERTTLGDSAPRTAGILAVVGVAAVTVAVVAGTLRGDGLRYFQHAWLVNFCYYLSISIGGLFFVAMLHVTRAGWGVVIRRIAEVLAANFTLLAILFLPLLFGLGSLYEWADPLATPDELIEHKAPYLNPAFFAARAAGYFIIWWLLSRFFFRRSVEQDASGNVQLTLQMERWSGPALLLLALTVTFAAFDWLMSLDARWASTIFGLYYFAGAMVAILAIVPLAAMALQARGRLRHTVNAEHYHDLGKLLFAFVIFWGYMAFSQYMLIWYANIPEETAWYRLRTSGPWGGVAVVLLFAHLLIPFLGLMPRAAKRRKPLLAFWAVWLLAVHWLDLYWLVMPGLSGKTLPFGAIDLFLLVGMGALYAAGAIWTAGRRSLVPLKDPRLAESLAFENM